LRDIQPSGYVKFIFVSENVRVWAIVQFLANQTSTSIFSLLKNTLYFEDLSFMVTDYFLKYYVINTT